MKKKDRNPTPTTSAEVMCDSPFTVSHTTKTNTITSSQTDLCAAIDATSTASAT